MFGSAGYKILGDPPGIERKTCRAHGIQLVRETDGAVEDILVIGAGRIAENFISCGAEHTVAVVVLLEIELHGVVVLACSKIIRFIRRAELDLAREIDACGCGPE